MKINSHISGTNIGKVIRFFSYGKYNHTSIEINNYVYEANFKYGVIRTKTDIWNSDTVAKSHTVILTKRGNNRVLSFLEIQLGKKYDWIGVFSFVFQFLKPRAGYWFCSELGMAAFLKAIDKELDDKSQKISPTSLHDILEIKTSIRKVV